MKTLIIFLLCSFNSYADYGKPQLVARYSAVDSFNAPLGLYCFSSEPQPTKEGVFLGCMNQEGEAQMVRFSPEFEVVAKSENGLFSHPKEVAGKSTWYEFSEAGVKNLFEYQNQKLKVINLKNLGPVFALIDSFTALKNDSYVYRLQDETKKLQSWKDHTIGSLFAEEAAHIFPPVSSFDGDFITKVRRENLNENAPDELILWNGSFKTILKDRDAEAGANYKSFRHQYALDKNAVALVVTDDQGEALIILDDGRVTEVARAGKELLSFDYFSPKMRGGVLVFRGMDLEKRKAIWVFENHKLKKLLTQGDVVKTDKGLARVDYQSQDALFYG
ncbi:MAG: hypothetical protein H0V66_00450, partial [Bdellovibrionales bacterium]|nr:hypothetical protein [Bdellovibrionales bacterium]